MTTHSAEDVQRLVAVAQEALDRADAEWLRGMLAEALFPFREQPDAEVIEAMVQAMSQSSYINPDGSDNFDRLARAALAAYRAHAKEGAS